MNNYEGQIISNPNIMLGKPVIKGTRITVELILKKVAEGYSFNEIIERYPHLKKEQIIAALEYAVAIVANEEMID